jgi:hypothetical protein
MQQYALTHPNEKMLYLAPQAEILNQIKNYIVKYIHGKQGTVGKSVDEIIAEVFPNITFESYPGLLAKRGKESIKEQYGMIVLDEIHRTGAKEWEGKIDTLLENQNDDVKVLGLSATPTRDVDGRDMAEETARKLGYTDEEIKSRKYFASNMSLENAIRMGYVVNPKLVYCKYDLISSGKMDNLKAEIDDIDDENKRAEKLQKYNEIRAKLNAEIDAEIGEEARKQLEEEARKNLDSGIGKEEILKQNVKKGGKYVVFIPVTEQGDIEDEDGNKIGTKTGENKIKAYQDYLNKVFEGTDIVPKCHAMSGSWNGKGKNKAGEDRNQQELNAFESDDSDETKFMVVMNKANEGLHIDGVDGIIWFRALDENSRILYLQQLGRAIYALDEDNPLSDDKRPVIIDLTNNSLTVKIEKDFENSEPIDDLESLIIVKEWIDKHDGMLPDRNSTNKQEQHYYAVLRRIQSKYAKYLEGFDNFEDLTDEEKSEIQEIIELASEIDLWNMDLPPIPKTRGGKDEFDPFKIDGVLRDYVEFEDEIDEYILTNQSLKIVLKVEKWCKENFGDKPLWERRLPYTKSEDEEEKRLGIALNTLRKKLKQYNGKQLEKVENEDDRKILEIVENLDEEYAFGINQVHNNLGKILKIEKWCKENFKDKPLWERRLPNKRGENEEEKRIGNVLANLKNKKLKQYNGKQIEEVENEDDRKILEIVRKLEEEYAFGHLQLHENLGTVLKIEDWCKENFEDKPLWERRLPNTKSEDEEEKMLGVSLYNLRVKVKQYEGKTLKEVENEDYRKILEIIGNLDEKYAFGHSQLHESLGNALEIENYCKENFGDKPIWERKLPYTTSKDEEEKRLGTALKNLRKKLKQYEGKQLEEVENEEDRKILEIVRRIDEEYNPKKLKQESLKQAKQEKNEAKIQSDNAKALEQQVSQELKKRGKTNEEQ